MKHRTLVFALAVLVVACGGDSTSPATGPLKLGIVSGNNQSARASDKKLTDPVIGKLVRSANGTVSFRWIDALLPAKAFAQGGGGTVVTGSPVPGAVVCAVSVDSLHPLTPFVPCTNTDANGQATFFFTTGTTAGTSRAEIRGTLDNQPAVFDTAKATVLSDTLMYTTKLAGSGDNANDLGTRSVGDTIRLDSVYVGVYDKYLNQIPDWQPLWVFSSDSVVNCCLRSDTRIPATPSGLSTGRKAVVPAGARTFFVFFNGDTATNSRGWFILRTR